MTTNTTTTPDYPAIIGRQVKKIRAQVGITQLDLANRCDIFRTYLSRIELGKANPTISVLADLANAMNVHVSELLAEEPTE